MANHSKIRYSLVFNRKGELNQYGEALIQIRAYQTYKGCRFFSTGITVRPEHWDKRNRKINPKHPNHFVYNQRINDQLTKMEVFEIAMINRYGSWPLDRLQEYETDLICPPKSFTDFFETEIELQELKPDSLKMYWLTFRKLQQYRPVVYFEDLSFKFIQGFDTFLRSKWLSANSVKKHHDRLRRYINLAVSQDLLKIDDNPYKKFRAKSEEPTRVYLSSDELEALEKIVFSKDVKKLERARDVFLFSCYTGLRFGDVTSITPNKIEKTSHGLSLTLTAQKTNKRLDLPLYLLFRLQSVGLSRPEQLLRKYLEKMLPLLETGELGDFPLFNISNQYLNRSLKEVAKLAGIRKPITSHVARRTFATIMARKVKAPILQRLLQHSRPDMTNIYIQLSNKAVEEELEQIEW
jgi:integrase